MEAEKTYRNRLPRIIRQNRGGEATLEFADNRPGRIFHVMSGTVQRLEDDDDALRRKNVEPVKMKNETGLPDNLKAGIEDLSGFAMDDVRVHFNSDKPAAVKALAYTQGTDIYVAPGQEQHLPHEAWHVAQQMAGRVHPTVAVGGMPLNDSAELEHEADMMGAKANSY